MDKDFEQFLAASSAKIPIMGFVLNIFLTAILSSILSYVYTKFGYSLSNRKQFGRNFVLIALTTMLVITIVKSSLALSLGLVGALSIIRFRAAIKEPEELAYLFLAIAIGLGLGANQTSITIIAFFVIVFIMIVVKKISNRYNSNQLLNLSVQSNNVELLDINLVIDLLKRNCDTVDLRRLDETEKAIDASFLVETKEFTQLNEVRKELRKLDNSVKVTFLDNKGLI